MKNKWNIFETPVRSLGKTCYGIMPISMGQLLICNEGNGFYGCLNSNIKDNLTFTSMLCGKDIEKAKKDIIMLFKMHLDGISQLCMKQYSELE